MSEKKTETMLLRTPDQAPCTSPLAIEAAGQRYRQTTQLSYLGGPIDASADIMPQIKRRVQLAWACYSRFERELYDMEAAPFALKLRMLKAEVMETLPYGCVSWTLGKEHFAELRTAHHRFLLRMVGFERRQRTDHLMSYARALKKKGTMRKRRDDHPQAASPVCRAVQRTHNERLTRRVMFWTMAGGENLGPGRPEKTGPNV